MLERNDCLAGRVRWEQDLAWWYGRAYAEGNTLMQKAKEIHVRVMTENGQTMPQVQTERLAVIHRHQLSPDIVRFNLKESPEIMLK